MTLNGIIAQLVNSVANVAPWLAPLPTAWLIYDRTMRYLHWPQWVAVAAGVTLELLGVAILATTLDLYDYNGHKRKTDPRAPLWLGIGLSALYFVTAILLTVFLDIWPAVARGAPALFPVLSVASFALLALRMNHERRVTGVERDKAEAKERRAEAKAEKAKGKANPARYKCDVAGCDFASATRNGLNAHGRAHRTKGEGT